MAYSGASAAPRQGGRAAELNARLRTIFEDSNYEYGDDVDGDQLSEQFSAALRIVDDNVSHVVKSMRNAHIVDLCFLVDITGSMDPYIEAVKNYIAAIVRVLQGLNGAGSVQRLRLAFVGYRDLSDTPQFEVINFGEASNPAIFRNRVAVIEASGGGDACEDVLGGLENALLLGWSRDAGTRVLFHIADAPCHGTMFHNPNSAVDDSYPHGTPGVRSIAAIFTDLRSLRIQYCFGKINSITDEMVRQFSRFYGDTIGQYSIDDVNNVMGSIIAAVGTSIATTLKGGLSIGAGSFNNDLQLVAGEPNWASITWHTGTGITFDYPRAVGDLNDSSSLPLKTIPTNWYKISANPFDSGYERYAYYGKEFEGGVTTPVILKEYRKIRHLTNPESRYEEACKMQIIASYLMDMFLATVKSWVPIYIDRPSSLPRIVFLRTTVMSLSESEGGKTRLLSCESRMYPISEFIRFNNTTSSFISPSLALTKGITGAEYELLQAFPHFTYKVTGGYLMVADLEGAVCEASNDGGRVLFLTDPTFHCTDSTRFHPFNFGRTQMQANLADHSCNQICEAM